MTHFNPATRRTAHGFSLMELLVVIAIIALISVLLIGSVTVLKSGAQESQTRTLLAAMMGLAGQFETQTNADLQQLTKVDKTYDWSKQKPRNSGANQGVNSSNLQDGNGDDPAGNANDYTDDDGTYTSADNDRDMKTANLYIERFLWAAYQLPAIRDKLPSLGASFGDPENDGSGDGFYDLVDPWGNPIAYANTVQHPTPNTLTSTNNYIEDDFLPAHKGPFFASAGADQRWGRPRVRGEFQNNTDWENYTQTDAYKFSVDNLYSFDIDRSAAQRGD